MASRVEEENWDDDFEFSNSPRNSPIPSLAPIHAFSHTTRPNHASTTSRAQPALAPASSHHSHVNSYKSTPDPPPRASSALPRRTSAGSRLNLRQATQQPSQHAHRPFHPSQPQQPQQQQPPFHPQQKQNDTLHPDHTTLQKKARYSGNSEEDWDMDPPEQNPSQPPFPVKPPTPLPQQHTDHPQPRPSLDSPSPQTQSPHSHARNGGNISPTMSAFSIPLSIDSSLRNHPHGHGHHRDHSVTGHSIAGQSIAGQSIGGSSTNFLLHTGRRSLFEIEKGGRHQQQDRERRRLRKKSRPVAGALPMDDDEFDVYARDGRAGVPRRYAIPSAMRGRATGGGMEDDGEHSSVEQGSSGEDELSELEEEQHAVPNQATAPNVTPPPFIKAPSRLLNLALNPTKSHDRLGNPLYTTTSPASSSQSPPSAAIPGHAAGPTSASLTPSRPTGVGSRSTTVTTVPAFSGAHPPGQVHAQGYSYAPGPQGPSRLVRKVSRTNVLAKSSPHMKASATLAKQPQQYPTTTPTPMPAPTTAIATTLAPVSKQEVAPVEPNHAHAHAHNETGTDPRAQATQPPPVPANQLRATASTSVYPGSPPHPSHKVLDDCAASLAPSTASHKETRRQALLSRLGSLKRWGQNASGSPSPSTMSHSGLGLGIGRIGKGESGSSPRVFGARLPSFLGGSKVDLHHQTADGEEERAGSDAVSASASASAAARSPGRKYGLLRRPSLLLGTNPSSSALAARREEEEDGHSSKGVGAGAQPESESTGKEGKEGGHHTKRGINPFRRVSIPGVKRFVGESSTVSHHQDQQGRPEQERAGTSPAGTPEKEKKEKEKNGSGGHVHHRTISFSALARGKLVPEKALKHKEKDGATPITGRKSSDGRESISPVSNGGSHLPPSIGPHTLGRTAALAKAPKPPLKALAQASSLEEGHGRADARAVPIPTSTSSTAVSSSSARRHADWTSTVSSMRMVPIPVPSSISTTTSTGYQSSATSAAPSSSSHKRTTSSATTATSMSSRSPPSSPISTSPPPFPPPPLTGGSSQPYQDPPLRPLGPSHTRDATIKPSAPVSSSSSSSFAKGYSAGENTPKPRANAKPLPDIVIPHAASTAATVGRLEGKSASSAVTREAGMRRGSAGDSTRVVTPHHGAPNHPQRGVGDLKIPARISMRQGSLKRELEAVKDFAAHIDELKRLQTTHQSIVTALAPHPTRSSSRASNQAVNPAVLQSIEDQYGIWWECAELLIDLGGAAPPTVAGTPIQENRPSTNESIGRSSSSSAGHYGTQRSFSSSSSGDLSSRQLELLKQMLSTPNPTSFHFVGSSSAVDTISRSGAEFSGSGSDHVVSDPPSSTRGTNSIHSAGSSHDLHRHLPSNSRTQAPSGNHPYAQGTWTSKNRSSANPGNNRPNLSGVFSAPNDPNKTPNGNSTLGGKTESRGTLADGSGSSATGGLVTTDDAEEASDWDLESSDSGKAKQRSPLVPLAAKAPSSSTASSSVDISVSLLTSSAHTHTPRLALTPETILPLVTYAKEVRARLVDCLKELEKARTKGRGAATTATTTTIGSMAPHSSVSRSFRAPDVGTSTLRRG